MQFYTLLTNTGLAKITNAQASGTTVNLTQLAVGDGGGQYYDPTETQTALVNEVWRGNLNQVKVDEDNENWLIIETVIPAANGGFTIREAGVYDDEGDMIAVAKYPQTYKPNLEEGSAKDLYIRMILEISNASVVTLTIDPAVVLASRAYVDVHTEATSVHEATPAATPNRIIMRAANGTAKVAAPVEADDIARKAEVDAHEGKTSTHGATAAATPNRIMMRDANGRAKVAAPVNNDDVARKAEVDALKSQIEAGTVVAGKANTLQGKKFVTVKSGTVTIVKSGSQTIAMDKSLKHYLVWVSSYYAGGTYISPTWEMLKDYPPTSGRYGLKITNPSSSADITVSYEVIEWA